LSSTVTFGIQTSLAEVVPVFSTHFFRDNPCPYFCRLGHDEQLCGPARQNVQIFLATMRGCGASPALGALQQPLMENSEPKSTYRDWHIRHCSRDKN
jgi:hypothetical protein